MKILVTGGSGLLGHKLVGELILKGYDVIAIYNTREPIVKGRWLVDCSGVSRFSSLVISLTMMLLFLVP